MRHPTIAGAIAVVILAASACGSSQSSAHNTPGPMTTLASPSPSPSSAPSRSPSEFAATATELGPRWQEGIIPGGAQVAGQVTLDLCGGGYLSEALRTSRLQVVFKRGAVTLSTEVVSYSPQGVSAAYRELLYRVAHCPSTPVAMPEQGAPKIAFALTRLANPRGSLPRSLYIKVHERAGGRSATSELIYQFNGNWMAGVYTANYSAGSLRTAATVAKIESKKLRGVSLNVAA